MTLASTTKPWAINELKGGEAIVYDNGNSVLKESALTISYSQFLLWTEFRYTMLSLNKPRCLYWDSAETLWATL